MGLYIRLLLVVADWSLAHRLPTIANSLVHLVSGTPRYEMIIYSQAVGDLQRLVQLEFFFLCTK